MDKSTVQHGTQLDILLFEYAKLSSSDIRHNFLFDVRTSRVQITWEKESNCVCHQLVRTIPVHRRCCTAHPVCILVAWGCILSGFPLAAVFAPGPYEPQATEAVYAQC